MATKKKGLMGSATGGASSFTVEKPPPGYVPRGDEANISSGALRARYREFLGQNKGQSKGGGKTGVSGLFTDKNLSKPGSLAATQYATNIDVAEKETLLNRPMTETGPYGTKAYTPNEQGGFDVKTSLSDWEQKKYQDQTWNEFKRSELANSALVPQLEAAYAKPLDYQGITEIPGQGDVLGYRKQIADQQYQEFLRQREPEFQQQQEQFRQYMADRGIPQGSEQWNKEYAAMQQAQGNARLSAQTQSATTGSALADQLYSQGLGSRQQGITERSDLRETPIREMAALLSGNVGPRDQQYTPFAPTNIQGVDVGGIGLGFSGLKNQKDIAAMNNAAQLEAANIAGSFALQGQELQNSGAANVAGIQGQNQLNTANANQPPKPNPWSSVLNTGAQALGLFGATYFGNRLGS